MRGGGMGAGWNDGTWAIGLYDACELVGRGTAGLRTAAKGSGTGARSGRAQNLKIWRHPWRRVRERQAGRAALAIWGSALECQEK